MYPLDFRAVFSFFLAAASARLFSDFLRIDAGAALRSGGSLKILEVAMERVVRVERAIAGMGS